MKFESLWDVRHVVLDLYKQSSELANSLANGGDENDWGQMYRIIEKLSGLLGYLSAEYHFGIALQEMKENKNSYEDEKFIFIVDKQMHHYLEDVLIKRVEVLLSVSRNWKFEDYRARNFQNDLRRAMEEIRDCYKRVYNL